VAAPPQKPKWATFLSDLGSLLADLPATPVGELAPRVIVSVPTGRFTYWFATSGALEKEPKLEVELQAGQRCATWADKRMRDVVLEDAGKDMWKIGPQTKVMKGVHPLLPVPEGTPDGRGTGILAEDYRDDLRQLPGKRNTFHVWFARHCLKPVVIVGTGREHIQRQRATILGEARSWFSAETAALLDDDSSMTSNPNRVLFHPYMVFDAGCDKSNPWIRAVIPRLVITTSWSSRKRMHPGLFQRAPQLIVCNRRVISATEAFSDTKDSTPLPQLQAQIDALGVPPGIFIHAYGEIVQPDSPGMNDDTDDESTEDDYL